MSNIVYFWYIFGHFIHFTPFCQMCDFREKLYNNNRHHFRPFSAKSLDSIFFKSLKTSFLGYFGLFWAHLAQFGHKPDFFQKCYSRRILEYHQIYHFQQKKVHINGLDFCQNSKNLILGDFGLFWAHLAQFGQKPEFFQTCGFRRMLEDHQIYHFQQKKVHIK